MPIPYKSISMLSPSIAYKILELKETNHTLYGKGQQATIMCVEGSSYRTQLPVKYSRDMSPEDVAGIQTDIAHGRNPYLIYRERFVDQSYRLDIVKKSSAIDDLYETGVPVPELQEED